MPETIRFLGRFFQASQEMPSDSVIRRTFDTAPLTYAYGPTIVKWNGMYHMFCCAADWGPYYKHGGKGGGDLIRHSTSHDGITWTEPQIVEGLYPHYDKYPTNSDPSVKCADCCCCDPSIVLFQGYWYLFYSGCPQCLTSTQTTAMYVARSATIDGPYLKYTARQTWEQYPPDPAIIIGPKNPTPGLYGAGQQSVVVRGGTLVSWFNDTTVTAGVCKIQYATSINAIEWTPPVPAKDFDGSDLSATSIDVKWDDDKGRYVCIELWSPDTGTGTSQRMTMRRRYSADGLHWDKPEVLVDVSDCPTFAANPGMAGTERGSLLPEGILVAYSATSVGDDVDDVFTKATNSIDNDMYAHYIEKNHLCTFARVRANVPTWQDSCPLFPNKVSRVAPRLSDRWTTDNWATRNDIHGNGSMDGNSIGIPANPIPLGGLIALVYENQADGSQKPHQVLFFSSGVNTLEVKGGPLGGSIVFMISDYQGSRQDNHGDCVIAVTVLE